MNVDLYTLPVEGTEARQFCGGNLGGEHEACVRFALIPGAQPAYVLTDSKPEGAGKEIRFTEAELDAFVIGYARERHLTI
ncbi:DUF397 domain-containing protein [Streptomyces niveiscabiei]|uniref:DUF397 domain-containing protein n=1 Tax=Streptomyces niveiscabiei TaxID=164115 RepID=UPI0029B2047E|nr:DUF397 domain-containing protein [Streptomyces niveiscabiei]MDX3383604.1 DUF397 domain-containing protein [Streptomyces niveiscabiei]